MPRRKRQAPGGLIYHVLNRAVARIKIFRWEKDFLAFERTLEEARARVAVEVLAYCVMPNHWHLVLRPRRDGELSKFMSWLTMTHAQRWRTSHGTVGYGPLYQGRFKSFPIQDDGHLITVLRYVERNPVRSGLLSRAERWRWSSLWRRLEGTEKQRTLLSEWPVQRRGDWTDFVNKPQTAAEEAALATAIARSRPYGQEGWERAMAKRLGAESSLRPRGRPRKEGE
jgi:putative transposase